MSSTWTIISVVLFTTWIIALVIGSIYLARFSNILANRTSDLARLPSPSVLKRTNDLSVASWFFVNFPILNVGLSAGLASNVTSLESRLDSLGDENTDNKNADDQETSALTMK
jgi:hypothetical protein